MTAPLASATPAGLRRALHRRLTAAVLAGPGSPLVTGHPGEAADAVIAVITPVLEAKDARISALSSLLEDILGEMSPYPREGSGFWRQAVPCSDAEMERRRAVLAGDAR